MSQTKLSVVLGTYNRLELLQKAVESIVNQSTIPVKVYITDAGSTDGTIPYLQSIASATIIPILVGKKLGQAKAYNEVFQIVDTPYVCWLSDDNIIVNHGLDMAADILDNNPNIGMVALKTKDLQGPFTDAPYIGGVSEIGILNVNQGMLRTKILQQLGGFSEEFRDYGIDPDLTAKVLLSGYDIAYTKAIAIHHYRNWEVETDSIAYQTMMAKQAKYKALYQEIYRPFCRSSWGWEAKKAAWLFIRRGLGIQKKFNSDQPLFLQGIPRDWHNIMTSRYISIWDAWRYRHESYHLLQHCDRPVEPKSFKIKPLLTPG